MIVKNYRRDRYFNVTFYSSNNTLYQLNRFECGVIPTKYDYYLDKLLVHIKTGNLVIIKGIANAPKSTAYVIPAYTENEDNCNLKEVYLRDLIPHQDIIQVLQKLEEQTESIWKEQTKTLRLHKRWNL